MHPRLSSPNRTISKSIAVWRKGSLLSPLPFIGCLSDAYADHDVFQCALYQRGPSFFLTQSKDHFSCYRSLGRPLTLQVMKDWSVGQAQSDLVP